MKLLWIVLLLITSLFGEVFIKEYTYHASENDSKLSARKAALNQVKVLAIEEFGVNVRSSYSEEQVEENYKMFQRLSRKMETFSQAFTQTKILKERWNGETFYVKVKIVIDPTKIAAEFKNKQTQSPKQKCEVTKKEVKNKLYDLSSKEKINALVNFAIKKEFNECHSWHYEVMRTFSKNSLNPISYRKFLLSTLEEILSPSEDKRSISIIKYLLPDLNKNEFDTIFINMRKMQRHTFNEALDVLSSKKNPVKEYCYDKFFEVSNDKVIGRPTAFTQTDIINYLLYSLSNADKKNFTKYYLLYHQYLTQRQKYDFYRVFKTIYFRTPTQEHFDIIVSYLKALDASITASTQLYDFVSYSKMKSKNNKLYSHFIEEFMKELKEEMSASFPFTNYHSGTVNRKKLFIEYDVKSSYTPTAKQMAEDMAKESNEDKQLESIEYLVLMKSSAYPAEKVMIQTLKKAKKRTSITSSVMEKKLIIALSNIKTKNKKAIYLIVDSLASRRHKVSSTAKTALINIGYPGFEIIKDLFSKKEDYVKSSMIEVMGTYQENKTEISIFLESIKTNNHQINRLREDAIVELKY